MKKQIIITLVIVLIAAGVWAGVVIKGAEDAVLTRKFNKQGLTPERTAELLLMPRVRGEVHIGDIGDGGKRRAA